jgi:glycosyltransferase involved in cell wall biosynthesis
MISIVLTAYNGEKFIVEQLQSILNQTRIPDEVIISDDKSTDNTVSIVKDFIRNHDLVDWNLVLNKKRKGWRKNFIDTISIAKGDLIFCSDQDDIWLDNKIEIMSKAIEMNKKISCLSGLILTIDSEGRDITNTFNKNKKIDKSIEAIHFSKKFNNITLLGCSMCFTKELANIIKDINIPSFSYDKQISRLSTIMDGNYVINYPVIKYRIHANNVSEAIPGIREGSSSLSKRKDSIKNNILWLEDVIKYCENKIYCNKKKLDIISKTIEFLKDRCAFLESKNIFKFLILIKYLDYYSNPGMYFGDFCYAFGINGIGRKIMLIFKIVFRSRFTI